MTPRVAVIGAGPAGLATLKALADRGVPAVAFDAAAQVGGLWVYGAPHSSAYRTLHLNTSRTRTEFADLAMPPGWPVYPDHTRIAGYLHDYARRFGLLESVRLRHTVTDVARADGRWRVTATGPDGVTTVDVEAVVVANGHNSRPRLPSPAYPGELTVEQFHSHDYRGPEQLAGRRVLVVGGGNSAMDIAVDASQVTPGTLLSLRRGVWVVPKHLLGRPSDTLNGALAAHLPWRLRQRISQAILRLHVGLPESYGLPAPRHGFLQDHPTLSDSLLSQISHGRIGVRPGIARLDGDRVHFTDGTVDEVDLVVWCTGYDIDLPFLDPSLLGDGADRLPLFRHVFHQAAPGLMFVGLFQSTGSALPVVEAQARLVAAHLAGEYALPAPAAQAADIAAELRAARDRWGDRRPAMRLDFDAYLALAAKELARGAARARRGQGVRWPRGERPGSVRDPGSPATIGAPDNRRAGAPDNRRAGAPDSRRVGVLAGRQASAPDSRRVGVLAGRRVVVTGASGTFGRLLCTRLAGAGARVVGIDLRADRIGATPVIAGDLTDGVTAAGTVRQAIETLGGLDLLINNAGVGGPAPAELPPESGAHRQLEVNLLAAWHTTAAAVGALERSRGRVVFVSSRMALLPLPLAAGYGVSKRALGAYADALRLEVGTHIGVSVVYPSMVSSPIHDATAAAGLSLRGVSRYEPVEGVVDAILRAATARRAPREVATTGRGRVELFLARHLPSVADAIVRRTTTRRIAAGDLDQAPLAEGMRRRAGR